MLSTLATPRTSVGVRMKHQIENYNLGSPRKCGVKSMKAALQSRTHIRYRVLLVANILALSVCIERSAAIAAAEASPATAQESSEKKDKDAHSDSKKDKVESSA